MNDTAFAPTAASTAAPLGAPPPVAPPSSGVRTVWLVLGSLFAVALLVSGTISIVDLLAHERTTEVTTYDGVGSLVISSGDGSVDVRAADVAQATVTALISEGLRSTGVTRSVEDGRLVLRSTCPNIGGTWCSVDWDVVVPIGTDVTVRSDGDRADLAGEFGALDVWSEHDGVRIDGVARSVVARGENGNVVVRLTEAPDSVRAISENNNVSVVVPDIEEGYRVEVSSDNGRTDIGIRTDPNAARTIEARSENGNVTVAAAP